MPIATTTTSMCAREMFLPLLFKGEAEASDARRTADVNVATPGYFETLGIPFIEGRDFVEADNAESRAVVVINSAMARFWKGSALGREVSLDNGKTWVCIVGVAGDTRQYGVEQHPIPEIFIRLKQTPGTGGRINRAHPRRSVGVRSDAS